MKKTVLVAIGVIAAIAVVYFGYLNENTRVVGAYIPGDASDCAIITQAQVSVNPNTTTEIVAAHSRNARVTIQQSPGAAEDVYLGLGEDASSSNGGPVLTPYASSTGLTTFTYGLATDLPYTGEVDALTDTSTTTVQVTVCRY